MTQHNGMPDNPGDPEHTDPEATSADRAEAAAEEAQAAQQSEVSPEDLDAGLDEGLDPTLDADLEEALADIDEELAAKESQDAAAEEAGQASLTDHEPDHDGDGQVDNTEALLAERTEDLQRLGAEYANYRRRTERERQGVIDGAKASVLGKFLPILDDLDLARQHGDLNDGPLKAISDKLVTALESEGLKPFGEEGEPFDPEIHEAVQDLSSGGEQALGTVLRRGYRVGDRVVRTAMVIIADADNASDTPQTD